MLLAHPVKAFSDNYIWLLHAGGTDAVVVDPGDAAPVLDALCTRGLRLTAILVTHHHADHVGGIDALRTALGPLPVYGPANSPADGIDHALVDGDSVTVLGHTASVLAVPGHTLDHLAYLFPDAASPLLFCGDTLFGGGCGRLFEGDAVTMHASLTRLAALPAATRVYCAHEYTESNLRFGAAVEPDSTALQARRDEDAAARARDEPTIPSTIGRERATNPFLRCDEAAVRAAAARQAGREPGPAHEVFAVLRAWKDNFR